jgi:hypothetical protein
MVQNETPWANNAKKGRYFRHLGAFKAGMAIAKL